MLHQYSLRIVFLVSLVFFGGFLEVFLFYWFSGGFFGFLVFYKFLGGFPVLFDFKVIKIFNSLVFWVFMTFCPIRGLPPGKKQDIEQIPVVPHKAVAEVSRIGNV